jgi:hypothetical protein
MAMLKILKILSANTFKKKCNLNEIYEQAIAKVEAKLNDPI